MSEERDTMSCGLFLFDDDGVNETGNVPGYETTAFRARIARVDPKPSSML